MEVVLHKVLLDTAVIKGDVFPFVNGIARSMEHKAIFFMSILQIDQTFPALRIAMSFNLILE